MVAPRAIANMAQLNALMDEAGDKAILIDFYATWCGPCKMIAPKLPDLGEEFKAGLIICQVDVDGDDAQSLTAKYQIEAMPTFIFLKNREVVEAVTLRGANFEKLKANCRTVTGL